MAKITYQGSVYELLPEETLLDGLTRQGLLLPSSCRSGVCQTCLMKATVGRPPADSQRDLKPTLAAQHYFCACLCKPDSDLEVTLPDALQQQRLTATLVEKRALNSDIVQLTLHCPELNDFHGGQFLNLYRSDGLTRSYSIANLPNRDQLVELHVRRLPQGAMSSWLHDTFAVGQEITTSAAHGHCFYIPDKPEQDLLLVGTGSGLAPLLAIIRDALAHHHRGAIRLYHGSRQAEALYLCDELTALAAQHPQFHYVPCVSNGHPYPHIRVGRADQQALNDLPNLKGWRVFICGNPNMVADFKRQSFLAGASFQEIYTDAFTVSPPLR